MKKLTLNEAWRLCLKQWKRMIEQLAKGDKRSIKRLKREWCKKNGFEDLDSDCFFCHYAAQKARVDNDCADTCIYCPGYLVNKGFDCFAITYSFEDRPEKFLAKLLELDKKRKSKKVK